MSRSFVSPVVLLTGTSNMTGTSKISSIPLDIRTVTSASFLAVWTGASVTGSFIVEGSLDYNPNGSAGNGTWVDMGLTITDANGPGSRIIDVNRTAVPYVRLSYTNATNSGSLAVTGCSKGV